MEVFIVIIIIILVHVYLRWWGESKWQEAYRAWAQLHGWSYNSYRDHRTYHLYSFLSRLQKGSNRYALDVLKGTWEGYPATAFNFHYETHSTSTISDFTTTNHHFVGVVLIQIERNFPELLISPQSIFERIGSALGLGGIKFQEVEFTKRFTIRCTNEKFAYDVCDTKMMNYLLANPNIIFELKENIAVLYKTEGRMNPYEVEDRLVKLFELRQLLPKPLFGNYY